MNGCIICGTKLAHDGRNWRDRETGELHEHRFGAPYERVQEETRRADANGST